MWRVSIAIAALDQAPDSHLQTLAQKRSDGTSPLIDDIRLLGRILGDVIQRARGCL